MCNPCRFISTAYFGVFKLLRGVEQCNMSTIECDADFTLYKQGPRRPFLSGRAKESGQIDTNTLTSVHRHLSRTCALSRALENKSQQ